jgi:hypothetical protein
VLAPLVVHHGLPGGPLPGKGVGARVADGLGPALLPSGPPRRQGAKAAD